MSKGLALLLDADMSSRALMGMLIELGHDVKAAGLEPALKQLDDRTLFAAAQLQARIMVTHNSHDYGVVLREYAEAGRGHAGCIISFLPTNAYGEMKERFVAWFTAFPTMDHWRDLAVTL